MLANQDVQQHFRRGRAHAAQQVRPGSGGDGGRVVFDGAGAGQNIQLDRMHAGNAVERTAEAFGVTDRPEPSRVQIALELEAYAPRNVVSDTQVAGEALQLIEFVHDGFRHGISSYFSKWRRCTAI